MNSPALTRTFETIDQVLAQVQNPPLPNVSLEQLLTALFVGRYTGSIRIDLRNGRPLLYSFDAPRRGKLASS